MLEDLEIKNGTLDLKFNKYIYEYTATVNSDIHELEFAYKVNDNVEISIRDNILNNRYNIVYLDVYNDTEAITYTFYVYKEISDTTSGIDNYMEKLEVNNVSELKLYKVQFLAIGLFIIIIIIFTLMFRKKKDKNIKINKIKNT